MAGLRRSYYVTTQRKGFRHYVVVCAHAVSTPRRTVTFQHTVVARRFTRSGAAKRARELTAEIGRGAW